MRITLAVALALVIPLVAVAALLELPSGHLPETKDRLSPEAMEQLVEEPMTAVRERGLAAGETEFSRLRSIADARYGSNSVRIADLRTAFGVELYYEGRTADDPALLRAARRHLHEAIASYRTAFGPDHPEVAVALHSFADIDIELHGGHATPQAKDALREALQIRRAALGLRNHETLATERRLESIR